MQQKRFERREAGVVSQHDTVGAETTLIKTGKPNSHSVGEIKLKF